MELISTDESLLLTETENKMAADGPWIWFSLTSEVCFESSFNSLKWGMHLGMSYSREAPLFINNRTFYQDELASLCCAIWSPLCHVWLQSTWNAAYKSEGWCWILFILGHLNWNSHMCPVAVMLGKCTSAVVISWHALQEKQCGRLESSLFLLSSPGF